MNNLVYVLILSTGLLTSSSIHCMEPADRTQTTYLFVSSDTTLEINALAESLRNAVQNNLALQTILLYGP